MGELGSGGALVFPPEASIRAHSCLCDTHWAAQSVLSTPSLLPCSWLLTWSQPGGLPALTLDCTPTSRQQAQAIAVLPVLGRSAEGVERSGDEWS